MPGTKEILTNAFRSRWTVLLASLCLLVLMEMTFLKMDVGMPALEVVARQPRAEVVPLSKIEEFCSTNEWKGLSLATGMLSAFYTTNFVPPPPPPTPKPAPPPVVVAPTPPPAPPPPVTKKIPVIYQGFSESAAGLRQAFIKVGDALVIATNGATVIADFTIADFDLKSMTLRNGAHTNVFGFNAAKEIELPAK